MTPDEVRQIVTQVALLSEKPPKSMTVREAEKLEALQEKIQDNFSLFFTKLTDGMFGDIMMQEDDFEKYIGIDLHKRSKPPEIPDHELSKEHLEELSRKVTQSYNTVAGVYSEIKAIRESWEIKIKRAERIIKLMAGASTVDKGNSMVALIMPEKIMIRYDQYVYWEEKFKTMLDTLKNSKEVISNLVKMYCMDLSGGRDQTVTEPVRPALKSTNSSSMRAQRERD